MKGGLGWSTDTNNHNNPPSTVLHVVFSLSTGNWIFKISALNLSQPIYLDIIN